MTIATALAENRVVLSVEGTDAESFLQNLLTNDVAASARDRGVYAALLTPQGKFQADMILWRPETDRFLLDVAAPLAGDLSRKLGLYKLRAAVAIAETTLRVRLFWSKDEALAQQSLAASQAEAAAGGPDPRDPRLGWRLLTESDATPENADPAPFAAWDALRINRGAPEAGSDLRPNDAYPLEYDFERLQGVDFKKGCFVGQEIVARMKHKATLKKGLFRITLDGAAPEPGAEIQDADGKAAGSLGSTRGDAGLALLRLDRAEGALRAGAARIVSATRVDP